LWMAPEVMLFKEFNEKCDVYSFGIVLWEILTKEEPFVQYQSFDKFKDAVCYRHERPIIPSDTLPSLSSLISSCWDQEPSKRPNFKEIIIQLENIMAESAIRDEQGRNYWKQFHVKKEEVPWSEFIDSFAKYIKLPKNDNYTLNMKCMHAILAETPKSENISGEIVHIDK